MESKSYAALDLETLAALDPNTSYARIRDMVGSGKRVLDVGCGPGNLATILSRTGNVVVGIDKDHAALASAQRGCERTIAVDLDSAELDAVVGDDRFDVVVFADVLEHLRHPVRLLSSSRRVLRDAGCVVVSIPNVAHGAVRLALLRGRFEYQQLGILDDTHIRFYTRESVLRLLSESGFAAVRLDRTTAAVFERSDLVPLVRREDYDAGVVAEILRDEDAETLQFVVRAAPVAEGQVAAVLTAEITSLQQAVRMLRAQLAQAHDAAVAERSDASSAAALEELRARYELANDALEPLRAELGRANVEMAEAHENLRVTRALLAVVEHELHEARAEASAMRAERDDAAARAAAARAALGAAETAEREARDRSEALQEARAARRAMLRRTTDLESLLAVERTSREHVEEASDRILAVARDLVARASESELRRLLASSAVVDMELRLAAAAARRMPQPVVPPPIAMPPALVLRAATVGRRVLTMMPPRAGRRERLRARWRRLRQLLPLLLLLVLGSSA